LKKALDVSETAAIRLVPRQCLGALWVT
jgi:hypothetical protein